MKVLREPLTNEAHGLTPEQTAAIALGPETCHYVPDEQGLTWWDEDGGEHYEEDSASEACWTASCDRCGYMMQAEGWFDGLDDVQVWTDEEGRVHHGLRLMPNFAYCPNCGRRVV